jgi:hypothetical protein
MFFPIQTKRKIGNCAGDFTTDNVKNLALDNNSVHTPKRRI